jgi:hypothetical protein
MSDNDSDMQRFVKQGLAVREILQSVEDALVHAGYDDFVVATEQGSFHWTLAPPGEVTE